MKNKILQIVTFLIFTGMYSQQENNIPHNELTDQATEELQYLPTSTVSKTYKLAYSIEEYRSMILLCKELTVKLNSFDQIIQNGSITKLQTKEWKKTLVQAKLLNYRIDDYTAMYRRINNPSFDYLSIQALNDYDDFSKVLNTATQYAGF